jgi:hypothetical protein
MPALQLHDSTAATLLLLKLSYQCHAMCSRVTLYLRSVRSSLQHSTYTDTTTLLHYCCCCQYFTHTISTHAQDAYTRAASIAVSADGRTATCAHTDGRSAVYGTVGFSKGVHYWEVKVQQGEPGAVFVGVAEKPVSGSPGSRLCRLVLLVLHLCCSILCLSNSEGWL